MAGTNLHPGRRHRAGGAHLRAARREAAPRRRGDEIRHLAGDRHRPRPAGQKPVHDLTTKPLEKVRVAHIGLSRGMTHVERYLEAAYALVVAAAAMVYPPAALAVAAVFLIALAVVADRREVKS